MRPLGIVVAVFVCMYEYVHIYLIWAYGYFVISFGLVGACHEAAGPWHRGPWMGICGWPPWKREICWTWTLGASTALIGRYLGSLHCTRGHQVSRPAGRRELGALPLPPSPDTKACTYSIHTHTHPSLNLLNNSIQYWQFSHSVMGCEERTWRESVAHGRHPSHSYSVFVRIPRVQLQAPARAHQHEVPLQPGIGAVHDHDKNVVTRGEYVGMTLGKGRVPRSSYGYVPA